MKETRSSETASSAPQSGLRALVGSYAKNVADDVQKNDLEPLRRKLERQRKKAEKRGAKKK